MSHRCFEGERRGVRVACSFHSRELRDSFQQLALEMIGGIAGIAGPAQIKCRQHSILRVETQVHGQRFAQAAQRDKGSRDGDAAEGDLCRQQHIAKGPAASCGGGLASAAFDCLIWIGLEYLPQAA